MQYHIHYENKITQVAAMNDFVHILGISVGKTKHISYDCQFSDFFTSRLLLTTLGRSVLEELSGQHSNSEHKKRGYIKSTV